MRKPRALRGPPPPGERRPALCPLCDRPLVPGPSVDLHHLVPKSQGGRDTVAMHRICHRKIHAVLNEKEIARSYAAMEALKAHPAIAAFIRWVARKPPTFTGAHRKPKA